MGNYVQDSRSRLRRERERRGWSRTFVADQIGSDIKSLARWERGEFFPTPQLRQKLCELFQMDAEALGILKPSLQERENGLGHEAITASTPEGIPYAPDTHEKSSQANVAPPPSKQPKTSTRQRLLMTNGPILILIVIIGVFFLSHAAFPWANTRILPGGLWIAPDDGQTVGNLLTFSAHAYPTKPTDPPIDSVRFTIRSAGHWAVGCIATPAKNSDIFSCTANLVQLRVVPGSIRISFDVYDHAGNYNLAPHGMRSVSYVPSP